MKGDTIVRFVKPSMILSNGAADGSEFRLHPSRPDDTGLSVNWPECCGASKVEQLEFVRSRSRLGLKQNGRFAELNLGTVLLRVADELDAIRMIHDPLDAEGDFEADPTHSEILGLPAGDTDQALLIGDLIAECVVAMHPTASGSKS